MSIRYCLRILNILVWIACTIACLTILILVTAGLPVDRTMVMWIGLPAISYLAALSICQITKLPEKMDKIIKEE